MSELKTNKISTNDQNNVAIDNALNLKSYTTAQRDALTSVAGDMIYNTTTSKVETYNGSAWEQAGGVDAFSIEYLVIAGGGGGNTSDDVTHGAGGAGGYLCNVNGENSGGNSSAEPAMYAPKSTNLTVTVGAGGGVNSAGSVSIFTSITAVGGGSGHNNGINLSGSAGSPNGRTSGVPNPGYTNNISNQGSASGDGVALWGSGGAGGAGAAGSDGTNNTGGNGGNGLASSITGSSVTRGGGGGGGGGTTGGTGGSGGGGNGGAGSNASGTSGTANTGGGGGGSGYSTGGTPGSGGSGIVILRWATADATIGATRTGLTDGGVQTDGSDSYIVFTAGTGTISFS